MINNIYRDEILEHYKDPQNFGRLPFFDVSSKQLNPFCGDEIEIFVKLSCHPERSEGSKEDSSSDIAGLRMTTVGEISFTGKGCAISIASASILTQFAKGKSKSVLTKFSQDDMLSLLDIEVSETRKKCALLGWAVLRDCLAQGKS